MRISGQKARSSYFSLCSGSRMVITVIKAVLADGFVGRRSGEWLIRSDGSRLSTAGGDLGIFIRAQELGLV